MIIRTAALRFAIVVPDVYKYRESFMWRTARKLQFAEIYCNLLLGSLTVASLSAIRSRLAYSIADITVPFFKMQNYRLFIETSIE